MRASEVHAVRDLRPIAEYLESCGHPLRHTVEGWRGRCPIHRGENPTTFHVSPDGRLWHCFRGCGGGDLIELIRRMEGISFGSACARLGAQSGHPGPLARLKKQRLELPPLNSDRQREMDGLCERLARDRCLQEQLAESRNWELPTISSLACPTSTSPRGTLGWLPRAADGDGGLCFIYPNSIKVRPLYRDPKARGGWKWHRPDGSKSPFWFWKGWPWNGVELWREDRLETSPIPRRRCILTEGEPDSISMIDDELENPWRAVMALPSATIGGGLKARLPAVLGGISINFIADSDTAGQKAVQTLKEVLRGRNCELRINNPSSYS
jgi:hypothetical protein